MQRFADAGLGLDDGIVRLERTTAAWVDTGARLRTELVDLLGDLVADVEQIGSSSVIGLLAKPIVDLAVGVAPTHDLDAIRTRLDAEGWVYRGDAGDQGGHVFVLTDRPGRRVAHLHVVAHQGMQWRNYLAFRETLRASAEARTRYEVVKLRLVEQFADDRVAYTDGKTDVVRALLDGTS